jgi:hypothetical protein
MRTFHATMNVVGMLWAHTTLNCACAVCFSGSGLLCAYSRLVRVPCADSHSMGQRKSECKFDARVRQARPAKLSSR